MSTRFTRRTLTNAPLTIQESLLLAQAVWEVGAAPNSWSSVSKLLSKHPLLSRPKTFFNAQACHSIYEKLMKDAELELNEANHSAHAPANRKLAEKYYRARHAELRDLIMAEESKFRTVLKEIDEIKAGLWDQGLKENLTGELPVELPTEQDSSAAIVSDEVFDGSELSGVTESAESISSPRQTTDDTIPTSLETAQETVQETTRDENPLTDAPEGAHDSPKDPSPADLDLAQEPAEETLVHNEIIPEEFEKVQDESRSPTVHATDDKSIISPNVIPESASDEIGPTQKHNVENPEPETGVVLSVDELMDDQTTDISSPHAGKRQEEEEEEEAVSQEDENKEEEEEEASQAQEDSRMNTDHDEDEILGSSNSTEQIDVDVEIESESAHTPAVPVAVDEAEPEPEAEAEPAAAEQGPSSDSEQEVPIVPARRSSRRRKSSAASIPPPTKIKKRLRSQGRVSMDRQTTMDSDDEDETGTKEEETTQPDDERNSSPFDSSVTRRGKRKASFLESADSPMEKKRMREDSEPAEEEEGPSSHNTRARVVTRNATRTEEQKRFQNVIGMLHSQISQHRNDNIFHNPIKHSEAPDYHEIVKRPMDLKTIKMRVKDGVIANSLEFQRDIFLMFANAMVYNRPGSDVHIMAEDMMLESEGQIQAFRQTEGLVKRGQRP